jgi:hypothetical protein
MIVESPIPRSAAEGVAPVLKESDVLAPTQLHLVNGARKEQSRKISKTLSIFPA